MADKSIEQLNPAERIYATDLFVLQQSGQAKKLTGQVLLNWLTAAADGHGGIQSIAKISTSGLVDTYRITLADTTTFDFVVTNGRSVSSIAKTSTSGLVDTYTITYNNGTTSNFTVTNGAKGDKGDNTYTWIKYASQQPTEASHSMGDIPDNWIGFYAGNASSAPTDWKQYKWFKIKGDPGATGAPATLVSKSVTYQAGDSGDVVPSGAWSTTIPTVAQGKYLWTKTVVQFNTGDPVTSYTSARQGRDGSGAVATVCGVEPDSNANIALTAENVGAVPASGGTMTGNLTIPDPTSDGHAATMRYVKASARTAAPQNHLDNSDFTNLIAQSGIGGSHGNQKYAADRWILDSGTVSYAAGTGLTLNGTIRQKLEFQPSGVTSAFVGMASGEASISYANGTVTITSSGGVMKWAALYSGTITDTTIPEYRPKGYAAELVACQRYYLRFDTAGENTAAVWATALVWAPTVVRSVIYTPVKMRINPTVTLNKVRFFQIFPASLNSNKNDYAGLEITEATSMYTSPNLYIKFTTSEATTGAHGFIGAKDDLSGYMELSADL